MIFADFRICFFDDIEMVSTIFFGVFEMPKKGMVGRRVHDSVHWGWVRGRWELRSVVTSKKRSEEPLHPCFGQSGKQGGR